MGSNLTKAMLGGKLMFPSDYVAAVEFKGRDVTLTIAGVQMNDLVLQGGAKKRKPILTFKETKKKFVLNPTNASTIAEMYGVNGENWPGKKITLYPTRVQFGREMVDAVRIRNNQPKATTDIPATMADHEPEEQEAEDFLESVGASETPASAPQPQAEANSAVPSAPAPTDADAAAAEADQATGAPNGEESQTLTPWDKLLAKLEELADSRGERNSDRILKTALKCLPSAKAKKSSLATEGECANILQAATNGDGFWAFLAPAAAVK